MQLRYAIFTASLLFLAGCASHARTYNTQAYAELATDMTYEKPLPRVWEALLTVFPTEQIDTRSPDATITVDSESMRNRTKADLETKWIEGTSDHHYGEYDLNGFTKKLPLPNRVKYIVELRSVMGGTNVSVDAREEVDPLKADGTHAGFQKAGSDSTLANAILEKIKIAIYQGRP